MSDFEKYRLPNGKFDLTAYLKETQDRENAEGIYCDQLQETFTRHTGLYTSL